MHAYFWIDAYTLFYVSKQMLIKLSYYFELYRFKLTVQTYIILLDLLLISCRHNL